MILATATRTRTCPATAPDVAARLGLGPVAAFDVAAVCSGFIYALAGAAGLIAAGIANRVLVIGAETFTTILNPEDRTTRAIFGDGPARWYCGREPRQPGGHRLLHAEQRRARC